MDLLVEFLTSELSHMLNKQPKPEGEISENAQLVRKFIFALTEKRSQKLTTALYILMIQTIPPTKL
jgi:hypothetical protein